SSLMKHAETGLKQALEKIAIKKPVGTFIPNVLGEPVEEPEIIRRLLAEQLTHPVQWVKTMQSVVRLRLAGELLELGPGRVLKGLARKINPDLKVTAIEKKNDLDQLKSPTQVPYGNP
ncbi:MAG TPA: malonyl CoA-acyl carrier protein transacylase, partial [Candidatus Omnitrophota bacterium]|nr:malonyl CoA-acyl carrier protein transacylase [Candidatus Omnitrophota bacterium]